MTTLKKQSMIDWEGGNTFTEIQIGCLQRIADATEKMALNYTQLQKDLERYKKWYSARGEIIQNRDRSISALRGQITKLKKIIQISAVTVQIIECLNRNEGNTKNKQCQRKQ